MFSCSSHVALKQQSRSIGFSHGVCLTVWRFRPLSRVEHRGYVWRPRYSFVDARRRYRAEHRRWTTMANANCDVRVTEQPADSRLESVGSASGTVSPSPGSKAMEYCADFLIERENR